MTLIIETITTENGGTFTISIDKYSCLYNLDITDKYGCHERRQYMTVKSAKQAIKRMKERY